MTPIPRFYNPQFPCKKTLPISVVVSAKVFLEKTTTYSGREIRGPWGRKKKQNPQYYTPKKRESGTGTLKNYKTSEDPITRTITP
jgi:hypothetical protein